MTDSNKMRADELLVKKGLCETRSQARNYILEGKVLIDGEVLKKPGKTIPLDSNLTVSSPTLFVSRAGEKLSAFIEHFDIDPSGKTVLDVGASTGGFTDCMLQNGAKSVVCVDVGHGQLHKKLQEDLRVTNIEKVNARELQANQLPAKEYEMIVMDLSFISLTKVLGNIWQFLENGGVLIALIKPQFELTREEVNKNSGVIKDPEQHEKVLNGIREYCLEALEGVEFIGEIPSPIKGGDGNQEFLIGLKKHN